MNEQIERRIEGDALRIYVACLASYNNGRLHGAWIDVEGKDADDLSAEIAERVLLTSPYPNVRVECPECEGDGDIQAPDALEGYRITCSRCGGAGTVPSAEEWAIHDHEGFGDLLGEYTPLAKVAEHAEAITAHGDAWVAYCEHVGAEYADADDFEDRYAGEARSEREYAEQLADDIGLLSDVPDELARYFDWESWTRDLFLTDYRMVDGHVFREC